MTARRGAGTARNGIAAPGRRSGGTWGSRAPASGPIAVGRDGAIVTGTVIADRYRLVAEAGWQRPEWRNLTGGIVALHRATA